MIDLEKEIRSDPPLVKASKMEASWVPATPMKPSQAEPGPICTDKQGNQAIEPILQGNPPFFSLDTAENWPNMTFSHLLALANAATSTPDPAKEMAAACSVVEGSQFAMSSLHSSFGDPIQSNFHESRSYSPSIPQDGPSNPYQHLFDLNSPPRVVLDAALIGSISSQFAPVTPDQSKGGKKTQICDLPHVKVDDRINQARVDQDGEVATKRVEVIVLDAENEQSHAPLTELQEKHNPDKGGSGSSDINKTAPQKARRRRYMPKVVREGLPKRSPKPRTPKPDGPNETPRVKRKYVRKKGLNNSPNTPLVDITMATDPKTAGPTRKSCRLSLNFDIEGQVIEESSSCRLPLERNPESHAQNFSAAVQSTVQIKQGLERAVDKAHVGIAYDLAHSMSQEVKSYISMPERQDPSPSTPSKTDLACDRLMVDAQNSCTRGKCRIVFSDVTHDKESSTLQMTNLHSAPRSPSDSNCSANSCSTRRKNATGLKRVHSSAIEEDVGSINSIGAHYNSLQAYLATFPVDQYSNNRIPGMYFPPIYKKKRSEKGHVSATSSSLASVNAAQISVSQTMVYPQNNTHRVPFTSESSCRSAAAQCNANGAQTTASAATGPQDKQLSFRCMLALGSTETKRKRSKGPTRVRDLASLIEIVEGIQSASLPTRVATAPGVMHISENSHQPHTCMDALVADSHTAMTTKKRTKRYSLANSVCAGSYPGDILRDKFIDILIEQLRHLDINAEGKQGVDQLQNSIVPYNIMHQGQNALVVYQRDGTVVPFEGPFNPIKKRRPRPRVDLDDETTRVWRLLLQDINSEGIDGTDEDKAKWWEEERKVFRGRADSFIARMHLVQGDRRFSKWKGSVVDSVVGVFLTQNVSDHLSSSAFMSLAARYPQASKVANISVEEPEACVLDLNDTINWHEVKPNQPACGQYSMTLQDDEGREVINCNEFSGSSTGGIGPKESSNCQFLDFSDNGMASHLKSVEYRSSTLISGTVSSFVGDQRELDDVISSQNSVISFQNSMDSSAALVTERSCSQSNSEAEPMPGSKINRFAGSTSFVELLQMAGSPMLHGNYNPEISSSKNIGSNQLQDIACELQKQNEDRSDGSKASFGLTSTSGNHHLHHNPNSEDIECIDMFEEVSRCSGTHKENEEILSSEESRSSTESASQATFKKIITVNSQKSSNSSGENYLPRNHLQVDVDKVFQCPKTAEDPKKHVKVPPQESNNQVLKAHVPKVSRETLDVTEGTSIVDNSGKHEQQAVQSNSNDNAYLPSTTLGSVKAETSKAKNGRTGKEKQVSVEWDFLRKQAESNGKRERTHETIDSLDWDAVRCADVNEIAYTIRERGMNNMLAERIKDFLNRIVREHGSIDLEWLRDVPPDKAKEYLLSIRGLGLKSVECVRLLTLHHLAFPVDTNVGRIAVRLGWVPLQPLPESLQLHLLELYPVLESIQKYLWPRLCKLDQGTLYELHYQMITFGKVFCTKSKPNCNACPMRGECRHFASAFASARLALPAPEERSIVTAKNKAANQSPGGIIDRLQLPARQINQLEAQSKVSNWEPKIERLVTTEPIIEVPASPEPIIEVPATPEPERIQMLDIDIEDFCENLEEIPTIKLNIEEFTQTLQDYMQHNMELQESDMSKALVSLTSEAASIPTVKLKNVSRLRTEHHVYELPDSHPLLDRFNRREPDDPSPYLLAIWTPGETANTIQPPGGQCNCQESGNLCNNHTCFACNSVREAESQTVRGTVLIPCRTAMRGSFPLNGTYFQVNEVFADHESSLNPIDVPRSWIWNLPRRTVFFGTSIPTIFKGLSTQGIQQCFWRGFVCVRGFDHNTRAPRPLMARLHFPASKLTRGKKKVNEE